jgi:hypothetical protein
MKIIDIESLLIVVAFIWAIWSTIRRPSRGKIWLMTVVAIVLGVYSGFIIAWRLYIPELHSVLGNACASLENDRLLTSMTSAAALAKLEDGKDSEAKSFLAAQVASYYRQLKDAKTLNAQQQKTLANIEELSGKSEILRAKLAELTKKQP